MRVVMCLFALASCRSLLRGLMLWRSREEVWDQLSVPPCVKQDVRVRMCLTQRLVHAQLLGDFWRALAALKQNQSNAQRKATWLQTALDRLTRLRRASCHPDLAVSEKPPSTASQREAVSRLVYKVRGEHVCLYVCFSEVRKGAATRVQQR